MLRISSAALETTLVHLRSELPHEGVGIWVGRKGWALQAVPLHNIHNEPRVAYTADPAELLKHLKELEASRLELVAIYHSHPNSPATPSQSDIAQAFWRVPYVIVEMQTEQLRAWKLPELEEVSIHVDQ